MLLNRENKENRQVVLTIQVEQSAWEKALEDAYEQSKSLFKKEDGSLPTRQEMEEKHGTDVFYQDAVNSTFPVALVEAVVGILVGVLWGYVRKLDFFFTELYNVLDNIPQTLLLILISYILKPGVSTIVFALSLTGWLGMARFIRNQIIIIRDRDYNLASRCLGISTGRIIVKNLLPYMVSVITMRMALAIPSAIGNEVFVTYIGIGLPVDTPSLGNLIQTGRSLMTVASLRYQLFFPVAVLVVITVSFYIIGNAFADAADPKNHVR